MNCYDFFLLLLFLKGTIATFFRGRKLMSSMHPILNKAAGSLKKCRLYKRLQITELT